MAERQPIAFLSYVRSDDDHDEGRITVFRKRLEGEVRMQTGKPFAIFQDRNDIAWGQHWEDRINGSLSDVTFLIPIITPSFFQSPACRSEFQTFSLKEKTLGINRLILPLYYVTCDQFGDDYVQGSDDIVDILRARNWTDWRPNRFKSFSDEAVATTLAKMAAMVKASVKELDAIEVAAAIKPAHGELATPKDIAAQETPTPSLLEEQEDFGYDVPEVMLSGGAITPPADHSYYVFTRRFDEVVRADELAEQGELLKLYNYISGFSAEFKTKYGPSLASKLSGFHRGVEGTPLAVTILVDNSGSMRGLKIANTAAWCLLIMEWMNRLEIPTEILGFTTRAWKGGQSRELWLSQKKPSKPGRLNDLRHLVYKSFSTTPAVAAPNFGVMAREGLLKENIDGEALLWAAARLEKQPAKKKMLFVFSDGAPVDDSTLSVNRKNFLEKHLQAVISSLSEKITLYAMGLEYDVSNYYPNSVAVLDTSRLGIHFFDTLIRDPSFLASWKLAQPYKESSGNKGRPAPA